MQKCSKWACVLMLICCAQTAIAGERLKVIQMPGDGDCLFWSLTAHQFKTQEWRTPRHHAATITLRRDIADALASGAYQEALELTLIAEQKSDGLPCQSNRYIETLKSGQLQGGELEIKVAAELMDINVIVHLPNGTMISYPHNKTHAKTTHIQYLPGHYNYLTDETT